MQKNMLIGYTIEEVEAVLTGYTASSLLARDICTYMYRRGCQSFLQMESIPLDLRQKLDSEFSIEFGLPIQSQTSADGTSKYLFKTSKGNPYETAFMPSGKRNTLCVSTQSGCNIGCSFCFTGSLGLLENLSVAQILGQLMALPSCSLVNRIVMMGMGEPLDNPQEVFRTLNILNAQWGFAFGAANITLSTVGILPQLRQLVNSGLCNIAISLHSPFPEQRIAVVPAEKEYPIQEITKFFRQHQLKKPLRLSFEYVVVPGENDSDPHIGKIVELLTGLICHVNTIPLNVSKPNINYVVAAKDFQRRLNAAGIPATLRLSRGHDIDAACGMMAGRTML